VNPHQALALGVRLFAVWYALVVVREVLGLFTFSRPLEDTKALAVVISGSIISVLVLLVLWFFPKSIARGLLPTSTDTPTPTLSYQIWFGLGTALLGLWFVASSIVPILRNLSVMYFFRPELMDAEVMRSLRVGLLYYAAEAVVGLCLLFGATGISKLVWRIRNADPD